VHVLDVETYIARDQLANIIRVSEKLACSFIDNEVSLPSVVINVRSHHF
jgi:hypothetical protein